MENFWPFIHVSVYFMFVLFSFVTLPSMWLYTSYSHIENNKLSSFVKLVLVIWSTALSASVFIVNLFIIVANYAGMEANLKILLNTASR